MVKIHELKPSKGARSGRKRVGRGPGSGHGQTSGRGDKGQKARAGGHVQPWFEGGQLPLHRRVPKRGFTNIFRQEYAIINLKDLSRFEAGASLAPGFFWEQGMIKHRNDLVKILGEGEISQALTISAHKFSRSAIQKIEAAGGRAEVIKG
jgi:large subunit ribosomal protein L15